MDHVIKNTSSCLRDISQISNSTEYREEGYTGTSGILCNRNLAFEKSHINYTILGNDIILSLDEKERPRKTKRPLMTSCFHRASVPHRDQMCTDPKVKKTGQLFGKQLSCICPNGKWPQAILVGLTWFISGSPKKI